MLFKRHMSIFAEGEDIFSVAQIFFIDSTILLVIAVNCT